MGRCRSRSQAQGQCSVAIATQDGSWGGRGHLASVMDVTSRALPTNLLRPCLNLSEHRSFVSLLLQWCLHPS